MCAIYGCPVDITAEPIEPSSRSLRATAFRRRLAGIGRLPFAKAVVEAEDISLLSISNRCDRTYLLAHHQDRERVRHHLPSRRTSSRRRGRSRRKLRRNQIELARLRVQR